MASTDSTTHTSSHPQRPIQPTCTLSLLAALLLIPPTFSAANLPDATLDTTQDAAPINSDPKPPERHPFPREQAGLAREAAMAASRGEWEEAERLYRNLVDLLPDHPLAHANLGTVLYRMNKLDDAQMKLESALRIDPDLPTALQTLGLIHFSKDKPYMAISTLTRAIHLDPVNSRLHHHLAIVLNTHGWRDAAEIELRKALSLDPNYADAHFNLAVIYLERTPPSIELARRHYFRATALGADSDDTIESMLNANSSNEDSSQTP